MICGGPYVEGTSCPRGFAWVFVSVDLHGISSICTESLFVPDLDYFSFSTLYSVLIRHRRANGSGPITCALVNADPYPGDVSASPKHPTTYHVSIISGVSFQNPRWLAVYCLDSSTGLSSSTLVSAIRILSLQIFGVEDWRWGDMSQSGVNYCHELRVSGSSHGVHRWKNGAEEKLH